MKNAFKWSIVAIGILCLVFFCGMFVGRHTFESPENTAENHTAAVDTQPQPEKININTANASQLQTLPGIGETLALRIIAYRDTNGPFTNTLQLKLVDGIGEKKLEEIIPLICVEDTP